MPNINPTIAYNSALTELKNSDFSLDVFKVIITLSPEIIRMTVKPSDSYELQDCSLVHAAIYHNRTDAVEYLIDMYPKTKDSCLKLLTLAMGYNKPTIEKYIKEKMPPLDWADLAEIGYLLMTEPFPKKTGSLAKENINPQPKIKITPPSKFFELKLHPTMQRVLETNENTYWSNQVFLPKHGSLKNLKV